MKKCIWITVVMFLGLGFSGIAQQSRDTILILDHFKAEQGRMLKWLPTSSQAFITGLDAGYNLYRAPVEVINGSEQLGAYEQLNEKLIRRWEVKKLHEELEKDSSLVRAAMFVQGADELINRPAAESTRQAIEISKANDMVHALAAMIAVSNNHVAEAMGLFFLDASAVPGKKYLYKIEVPGYEQLTSYTLVVGGEEKQFPRVPAFTARLNPGNIHLSWYNDGNRDYSYYNIYRSTRKNGGYERLNRLPYAGPTGNAHTEKDITFYDDSIAAYNTTYYYKVAGISAFEEEGPLSDPVEIEAYYLLATAPQIHQSSANAQMEITLEWAIDLKELSYIKGYNVFRSGSGQPPFFRVNEDMLKPTAQQFTDATLKGSSNYYIVTAYGFAGDSLNSVKHSRLLIDSIPPEKPVITAGVCDSSGTVQLEWEPNAEEDLSGYVVFRTYRLEDDPQRMTPSHIADTVFADSISMNEAYNKIYYRIVAFDGHLNASVPSAYFEVKIPDMKPPTNGVLKDYAVGMKGVTLSWQPSTAYDLKAMHLMRKSDEEFDYKSILTLQGDSLEMKQYTDTTTRSFVNYEYTLVSEDESGLLSGHSNTFKVRQLDKRKVPSIQELRAVVSRENEMVKLAWEFPARAIGFKIYRSRNGEPLKTYRFVEGTKREFYDEWLTPDSKYTYLMVAELEGGYTSGYSQKIEVNY